MTATQSHSIRDGVIVTVVGTVVGGVILAGLGKLTGIVPQVWDGVVRTVGWIGHRAAESYSITLPLWLWLVLVGGAVLVIIKRRVRGRSSAVERSHALVSRQRVEATRTPNIAPLNPPESPSLPSIGVPLPKASTLAQTPDGNDKRRWLRETSAKAIADQLVPIPPLRRKAVAKELFVGGWVRWNGKVARLRGTAEGGFVQVEVEGGGIAFLNFSKDEFHLIADFREGDLIRFEARVEEVLDSLAADLDSARLLPVE